MKRLLVFVFVGILFQGCISLHNGVIAPNSVDVSTDNFQIIKTIDGKATAGYFLGLGGGGRKGLVKEAKRDMYKNHPPSPNEMITNITVDEKKLFFLGGLYMEHTVFVSADVVSFGTKKLINENSSKYGADRHFPDIKKANQLKTGYTDYDHLSNLKKGSYVLYKNKGYLNRAIIKWKSGVTDGYFVWKIERFDVLLNKWQKLDDKGADITKKSIIAFKTYN